MSVPGVDQQQLIKRIGRALLEAAPPEWRQIRAEYRAAGRHVEVDVLVTAEDGQQPHPIRPPQDVVELLGELRTVMYRPGRGTWMSGLYVLDHPSKYSAEFEPDEEPRWRRVPPPIGFQDELRRFPREDDHIPAWMRVRAGFPPGGESLATPPTGIPMPPAAPGAPAGPPPGSGPMPSGPFPVPAAGASPNTPPGGFAAPPSPNTPSGGFPVPPRAPGSVPPPQPAQ